MGLGGVLRELFLSLVDHTIMKSVYKHINQYERHIMLRRYTKDCPPELVKCNYDQFYYETDGKPVILVGIDVYAQRFISTSKNIRNIKKVVSNEKCDFYVDGSFVNLCDFSDITDEEKKECVFLISSCWYFRDYCNQLIANGIKKFYAIPIYHYYNNKRRMDHYGRIVCWRQKLPYYLSTAKNASLWSSLKFSIDSFLRKLHIGGKYNKYKALKKYKNLHKGERCFILATGPSLTKEDAEALKNEYTFGVNSIYKMFEETDWRPTYYVMCDCKVYKNTIALQPDFAFDDLGVKQNFISDSIEEVGLNPCNMSKMSIFPICYLEHLQTALYNKLKYSSNLVDGLYNMLTVTNTSISIAQYMGFNEIYLLGVDFNYTVKMEKQHFDGSHNVLIDDTHICQSTIFNTARAYRLVKLKTEKSGVKVYNATRGGKLDIFERVDFDSLKLK